MVEPEKTVLALLDSLDIAPAGVSWQCERLSGAYSNRVWRAWIVGAAGVADCIVKHCLDGGTPNPLFPNCAQAEAEAARRLPADLVPRLLRQRGDWLVWRAESGDYTHAPEQAAAQLQRLHATPAWPGLEAVAGTPCEWVAQGTAMLSQLPATETVFALSTLAPPVHIAPYTVSVVHRDTHRGNWVGGEAALLADWQSVALGNPLEDVACYLARGMRLAYGFEPASLAEASRFLHASGVTLDAQWLDVQAAYDFRFACYCAWRMQAHPGLGRYAEALNEYLSLTMPVSKPSIDTVFRSRQ